jgi:hypothetical protein
MHTDAHGLRQGKRFLQRTRAASLIGELICIVEILFPSVPIRAHLWLKDFFFCMDTASTVSQLLPAVGV